jgi:hypothetical protein
MQVRGTQIFVGGQRLRHIGMNHAMLFVRELVTISGVVNPGLAADLAAINDKGFRFVRAAFGFYDYADWRDRYLNSPTTYWAAVQRVLDACSTAGLGIGVVFAFSLRKFGMLSYDVYGASQSFGNFGEPSSTLWALWRNYVTEFLTRFARHPAVWYWVPTDECMPHLGVEGHPSWLVDGTGTDQGGGAIPASMYSWGNKPEGGSYAASDKMTRAQWQQFSRMTVDLVHRLDPHARLVLSGNGAPASFAVKTAVSNSLTADTFPEWNGASGITMREPLVAFADRAYTGICGHLFMRAVQSGDSQYWSDGECTDYAQWMGYWKGWADLARKPFVVESFGVSSRSLSDNVATEATENALFAAAVAALATHNVDVAAAWNWGGTLLDGSLALDPRLAGAGPEWACWDLTHPTNSAKMAALVAANAARA